MAMLRDRRALRRAVLLSSARVFPLVCRRCLLVGALADMGTEMGLDNGKHLSRLKRFGEVGMRSGQSPLEAIKHPVAPRNNNKHRLRKGRPGFEVPDDLIPVELWQPKIDQAEGADTRLPCREPAERLPTIGEAPDLVPCALQAALLNRR